jgi:hypothetical protein
MNLIVCPSRLMAIYMLAYILQFGKNQEFHMCITGDYVIPKKLLDLAKKLNVQFIKEDEIGTIKYQELLIHSYMQFAAQKLLMSKVQFGSLTFYSDGLRNGFYGLPEIDTRLIRLVCFGLTLREDSFVRSLPFLSAKLRTEVVTFESLKRVWSLLKEPDQSIEVPKLKSSDLLIVMRHWGAPGVVYPFREDRTILGYLEEELLHVKNFGRVFVRSHPSFGNTFELSEFKAVVGRDIEVVDWDEMFIPDLLFPELTSPEAIIQLLPDPEAMFFGFDSSLNVLVGEIWPNTETIWPALSKYSRYFSLPRSTQIVSEQIEWMKRFRIERQKVSGKNIELRVDGAAISEVISSLMLIPQMRIERGFDPQLHDALAQERDWLVQVRDALTQERDALTQERDVLTQERDVLTQERDVLTQERDVLTQERDALTQERDALTKEHDVLTKEHDVLTKEHDVLTKEHDVLTKEHDVLTKEHDVILNSTIWRKTRCVRRTIEYIKTKL